MTEAYQHPIRLEVDDRLGYDRRSVIWRPILILPAYLLLLLFIGPWVIVPGSTQAWLLLAITGLAPDFLGVLALGTGVMITVRRRYPRWWFEAHAELVRFGIRFLAYAFLISDRYPSTDIETDVRVLIDIPPTDSERDRRIALVKPLLVIPHLLLFAVALGVACWWTIFAWFAALLGRRMPAIHRGAVLAALRYGLVIYGYAFLHLTDRYPRVSDGPTAPR